MNANAATAIVRRELARIPGKVLPVKRIPVRTDPEPSWRESIPLEIILVPNLVMNLIIYRGMIWVAEYCYQTGDILGSILFEGFGLAFATMGAVLILLMTRPIGRSH